MFRIWTNQNNVPKFKGMSCYFNVPFIGTFDDKLEHYYIIKPDGENSYDVCIHDKKLFSSMNGGCDLGINHICDRYQADEYFVTSDEELKAFLTPLFSDENIQTIEDLLIKLKQKDKHMYKKPMSRFDSFYGANPNHWSHPAPWNANR